MSDAVQPPEPPWDRLDADPLALLQHDLRTPLAVVRGQAQLLARVARRLEGPERERLLAGLGAIDAAATVLAARIARMGEGTGEPPPGAGPG